MGRTGCNMGHSKDHSMGVAVGTLGAAYYMGTISSSLALAAAELVQDKGHNNMVEQSVAVMNYSKVYSYLQYIL